MGVVTLTVCTPIDAFAAIEIVMGRVVAVPPVPILAVTPDPPNMTAVAPNRSLPVSVPESIAPGNPILGLIEVIAGTVAGPHCAVVRTMLSTAQPAAATML